MAHILHAYIYVAIGAVLKRPPTSGEYKDAVDAIIRQYPDAFLVIKKEDNAKG